MKINLKMKRVCLWMMALSVAVPVWGAERYAGGDISLLPEYVNAGAKYFDHEGNAVTEFLPWCHEQGMNAMRVRLFVNPDKYQEVHGNDPDGAVRYDPNACQDLEYITPLCKDIVAAGMDLMLDFHYSDTWADPSKQWTPIEWEGLTDEQLYDKVYDYTKSSLLSLKDAGVVPAFIQVGNEISYGMLWGPLGTDSPKKAFMGSDANWDRFGRLLSRGIEACREVCPNAKIVLHTERVAQINVTMNFYEKMRDMNIDYDIIGLSYYPFWHGGMSQLDAALTTLESNFPTKNIMIVETGYAIRWQVPYYDIFDHTDIWPISDEGQAKFAADLVETLEKHEKVDGLFWWWMEYNPYNTSLAGWYNAPLFDPLTGRATSAFKEICSFASDNGSVGNILSDNNDGSELWYDIVGNKAEKSTRGFVFSTQGKKLYNK